MDENLDQGCWAELIGKTIKGVEQTGGDPETLTVETTDGMKYEFLSTYSHSMVYVEKVASGDSIAV